MSVFVSLLVSESMSLSLSMTVLVPRSLLSACALHVIAQRHPDPTKLRVELGTIFTCRPFVRVMWSGE